MPYVQRDAAGEIIGFFSVMQPGLAEEWIDGEIFIPDPAPVLSRRQFFQGLAEQGHITWAEAAATLTGVLPAELAGYLDSIPDEAERSRAKFKAAAAAEFRIDDPLVPLVAAQKGWDAAALRAFWDFCAGL